MKMALGVDCPILRATVKEAVALEKISKEAERSQAGPRSTRSGTGQVGCSEQPHVSQRATNVRSCDRRFRRVVLLGTAAGIRRVKGIRRLGVRVSNWLTSDQGKLLLQNSDIDTLRGKRNYAMLAMLIGYGLRRGQLLALRTKSIQLREEHWVIADLIGKGGHIQTLPIPAWLKTAVHAWTAAVGNTEGRVFRSINKAAKVWGDGMTPKVLWEVVREAASRAGIGKPALHDLRRTCARLCHLAGGGLDQIQFLLKHVSIPTTGPGSISVVQISGSIT